PSRNEPTISESCRTTCISFLRRFASAVSHLSVEPAWKPEGIYKILNGWIFKLYFILACPEYDSR
uniref:Uncharacterized protein n=1 Tax=Ciona intestinalis TaxID=7719 RepID=H2XKJ5_CIOIN